MISSTKRKHVHHLSRPDSDMIKLEAIAWTLPILTGGLKGFKFGFIGRVAEFPTELWGTLSWGGGIHVIPYIEFQGAQWYWNSLTSLNCSGFFWYWKCTWKNPFLDLFWNCFWIQNFWQSTFYITSFPCPLFGSLLFVIKYYFSSAKGNLNNRPSHHKNVGPS